MLGQLRRRLEPGIRSALGVLDSCGALDYAQTWLSGLGLILMFHKVVSPGDRVFDPSLAIHSEKLDLILGYIRRRGWEIISANELHDRLADGANRRPFVCFTFDDGYADNYAIALPIFRRHNAPFCVNVTVGYVDRTTPGWWDALGEMLLLRDEIELIDLGQSVRIALKTWEEKTAAYQRLGQILYRDVVRGNTPLGDTWTVNGVDPQALSDRFFMTWSQLHELAEDPLVQIGAHTLTHPCLKRLGENEAGDEIEQSRQILEERLGVEIEHFAYPFGTPDACGEREFRLVRELGFKTAVTTRWCNIFPAHRGHPGSLPRKHLLNCDVSESSVRSCLYGADLSFRKRIILD